MNHAGRMRKIFDDMEAAIAFPPEPPAQPSGGGGGGGGGGGISSFAPASSSSAQSGSDSGGGMREENTKATRRAQINALRYVQPFFLAASTCKANLAYHAALVESDHPLTRPHYLTIDPRSRCSRRPEDMI
jgi:hypothetical protein